MSRPGFMPLNRFDRVVMMQKDMVRFGSQVPHYGLWELSYCDFFAGALFKESEPIPKLHRDSECNDRFERKAYASGRQIPLSAYTQNFRQ